MINKNIVISAVILLLIFFVYMVFFRGNKKTINRVYAEEKSTPKCPYNDNSFPLMKCKGGTNTLELQKQINRLMRYYNLPEIQEDSKFGQNTESKVYEVLKTKEVSLSQLEKLKNSNPEDYRQLFVSELGGNAPENTVKDLEGYLSEQDGLNKLMGWG